MKYLLMISFFMISTTANAQFAGLLGGSKSEKTENSISAEAEQEIVVKNYKKVLRGLLRADAKFKESMGLKEEAAIALKTADIVVGEECGQKCLEENTQKTKEAIETYKSFAEQSDALTDEEKKSFRSGAVEFLKTAGVRMPKLVKNVKAWNSTALDEVKDAGFMGASKLKKKLSSGFFIVSNLPSLASLSVESTKNILGFAQTQNINTTDIQDEANGDDDEFES
jgi:hypothetical protein